MKRLAVILLSSLVLIYAGLAATIHYVTGQPRAAPGTILRIPTGPHHQFDMTLVSCTEREPGYLVAGHTDFFSARYQPPWLMLPTAPPCP